MAIKFTKNMILQGLREVACLLDEQGVHGSIYLVGGAAISIAYNKHRTTNDVDAFIQKESSQIISAVKKVGIHNGWQVDWLNDAADEFIPISHIYYNPVMVFEEPGLTVHVASPEVMLGMKGSAARKKDTQDITTLLPLTDIRTVPELLELVKKLYPETSHREHTKRQLSRLHKAFIEADL